MQSSSTLAWNFIFSPAYVQRTWEEFTWDLCGCKLVYICVARFSRKENYLLSPLVSPRAIFATEDKIILTQAVSEKGTEK